MVQGFFGLFSFFVNPLDNLHGQPNPHTGATLNVGTMANIFTGGTATYTNIVKGTEYTLKSATGKTDVKWTATESKNTVINSDTQGFMIHQNANTLTVENGTQVNSAFTGILMKTGASSASMNANITSGSEINAGNHVILQMIDNDDTTTAIY